MSVRRASHANSWYSGSASQLDRELSSWLSVVAPLSSPARAVICPHAGYSYSGPTAAHRSPDLLLTTQIWETLMSTQRHRLCTIGCRGCLSCVLNIQRLTALCAFQFPTDWPQHCEDNLHPGPQSPREVVWLCREPVCLLQDSPRRPHHQQRHQPGAPGHRLLWHLGPIIQCW